MRRLLFCALTVLLYPSSATTPTIFADDANIVYTGRWAMSGTGASSIAICITTGCYLDVALVSSTISLVFDGTGVTTYPDVMYIVDGGNPTRTTLSSGAGLTISVSFPVAGQAGHKLRVWCEGIYGDDATTWTTQVNACRFLGLVGTSTTVTLGTPTNTMEGLGDSLIEGERILANGDTSAQAQAAHQTFTEQAGNCLGLRTVMTGYGGQGLAHTASNGAPDSNSTFALNFAGSTYTPAQIPIVTIVEPGTNDGATSGAAWRPLLTTFATTIRTARPKTVMFFLGLAINTHSADMSTVQAALAAAGDGRVFYLDYTTGVYNTTFGGPDLNADGHFNYSGSTKVGSKLCSDIQARLNTLGISLNNIGSGGLSIGGAITIH